MKNFWNAVSSVLPAAFIEWPVLSAGEQTRLSWARRLENVDAVPEYYRDYVVGIVAGTGAFPYVVLTPSYAGFLSRTTEKLLCATDDCVHCVEKAGDVPVVTVFPYTAVNFVEIGSILLKSWIKFSGKAIDGAYSKVEVKFNTVTDYLFWPVVDKVRRLGGPELVVDLSAERAKFSYLAESNFKFMNAARRSLLPGERVRESVMQQEIRTKLVTVFGRSFYRTKAPAHIMILTDKELIVVADENQDGWAGEIKHGSIRTCVPLAKIEQASYTTLADDLLLLSIGLPGDEHLEFCFAGAQQAAVEQMIEHIAAVPDYQPRN
jgi:hypothetical protein